jgi:hypothetical protein
MLKQILTSLTIATTLLALPATVSAATLSISPTADTITAGDTLTVEVMLNTQRQDVIGADVIILFDSAKLEVEEAELGDLFGTKVTDGSVSYGKIIFEAVALGSNVFNGSDTYATITFNALADGDANVDIKFTAEGDATDSNVTADDVAGTDLLTQVDNAVFTILEDTTTSTTSTTGLGGTSTATSSSTTKTTVPVSGHVENTIAMLVGGLAFLAAGLYIKKSHQ